MRLLLAVAASLIATSAFAADKRDDVVFQLGAYSIPRDTSPSSRSTLAGAEYRWADVSYGLRPTIGLQGNTDGAGYGYAGLNWDLPIDSIKPFVITPGVFAGIYGQGDSKDLGGWFEFREAVEVTYRFNDGQRVGASIAHLSNAGIGDINPGVETVQLIYSHPF